jgi:hypothetical protein
MTAPGIRSADGRWEWDGQAWRPVDSTPVPAPRQVYPSPPPRELRATGPQPGAISPDGHYYWDGARWAPTATPDARWRWTGSTWEPTATAQPSVRPFASPSERGLLAVAALAVACVGLVLGAVGDGISIGIRSGAAGRSLSHGEQQVIALVVVLPAVLFLLGYVGAVIAVPMWCHRVHRNLPALGAQDLSFSPGWAAGGWFIPVLMLWRPYEVLREIWQNSRPQGEPWTLLRVYWGAWLIANWVAISQSNTSPGGIAGDALGMFSNLLDVVAGVLATLVVLRITRGQETRIARLWPATMPPARR